MTRPPSNGGGYPARAACSRLGPFPDKQSGLRCGWTLGHCSVKASNLSLWGWGWGGRHSPVTVEYFTLMWISVELSLRSIPSESNKTYMLSEENHDQQQTVHHLVCDLWQTEKRFLFKLTYLLRNLHSISATFSQFFLLGQKTRQE